MTICKIKSNITAHISVTCRVYVLLQFTMTAVAKSNEAGTPLNNI
jgi:hypothetical protein